MEARVAFSEVVEGVERVYASGDAFRKKRGKARI
jgi:hypothetical protein